MMATLLEKSQDVTSGADAHLELSVAIMHALAHPLRLKIIAYIDQTQPVNVNQIYSALKVEQSVTSQHLRVLRDAQLVHTSRSGKFIYYSLDHKKLASASHLANTLAKFDA